VQVEGNWAWIKYINRGSVGDATGSHAPSHGWSPPSCAARTTTGSITFFHSSRAQP
jgi:hypothetical protein